MPKAHDEQNLNISKKDRIPQCTWNDPSLALPHPGPALYSLFQQPHLQNGIPVVDLFAHRVGVGSNKIIKA